MTCILIHFESKCNGQLWDWRTTGHISRASREQGGLYFIELWFELLLSTQYSGNLEEGGPCKYWDKQCMYLLAGSDLARTGSRGVECRVLGQRVTGCTKPVALTAMLHNIRSFLWRNAVLWDRCRIAQPSLLLHSHTLHYREARWTSRQSLLGWL